MHEKQSSKAAPPILSRNVPKYILKALDPLEVMSAALTSTCNGRENHGPALALDEIQLYLEAAKRQQRKIERIKVSMAKAMLEGRRWRGEDLFVVVHFYLICWTRIYKLATFIRDTINGNASKWNVEQFKRVGIVLRGYDSEMDARRDARNHLEHFEERMPGGKNQKKLKMPFDLKNIFNACLTYGGRKCDVGPGSIHLLKEIVEQLRLAVLYDSLESLDAKQSAAKVWHSRPRLCFDDARCGFQCTVSLLRRTARTNLAWTNC